MYRVKDGSLVDNRDPDQPLSSKLDANVAAGLGTDHEIVLSDSNWRYAFTLRTMTTLTGVLVVRAQDPASARELMMLKVLAQQTAAAMAKADLVEGERRQRVHLRELTDESEKTILRLSRSVAMFERREHIYQVLTTVSASGAGEGGIADALHQLTSLTVSVEDIFGNLRAWSPGPRPSTYQAVGGANREEVLRRASADGHQSHWGDRIFALIRPKADVLGVVALDDPHRDADRLDLFALEHAAAVLAVEMSHQRSLAETELRLCRDLVDDLLAGSDDASAYPRGEALGYDLRTPHRVTILQWSPKSAAISSLVWRSDGRPLPAYTRFTRATRR